MKKAATFTINVGNSACPNRCGICISEMTGKTDFNSLSVDWDSFKRSVQIAVNYRCENVLFTGKGEPLLFPRLITEYLKAMKKYKRHFTRFELQTSGDGDGMTIDNLKKWKSLGLDLVAVSAYHYDDHLNDEVFCNVGGNRLPLATKVKMIKAAGLRVRISYVLMAGYLDTPGDIPRALAHSTLMDVFQTTFRELGKPRDSKNKVVEKFVNCHLLGQERMDEIRQYFDTNGRACDKLPFGGTVYELNGQNACLTTCLDQRGKIDEIRDLIFFPDGTLATSWEYPRGTAIL